MADFWLQDLVCLLVIKLFRIPLYVQARVDAMALPDLLTTPSRHGVSRGGGGQLDVQTQAVLGHLHYHLQPVFAQVLAVLGWNARIRFSGFLAKLTGLSKGCVAQRLQVLTERRYCPLPPRNRGGRKRKRSPLPPLKALPYLLSHLNLALPNLLLAAGHADQGTGACLGGRTEPLQAVDFETDCEGPDDEGDAGQQRPQLPLPVPVDEAADAGLVNRFSEPAVGAAAFHCLADMHAVREGMIESSWTPCPYRGLATASVELRNLVAGCRVAGLVVRAVTSGWPLQHLEGLLDFIDGHWPGEVGQLCHGRSWADSFADTVLATLEDHILCQPQV